MIYLWELILTPGDICNGTTSRSLIYKKTKTIGLIFVTFRKITYSMDAALNRMFSQKKSLTNKKSRGNSAETTLFFKKKPVKPTKLSVLSKNFYYLLDTQNTANYPSLSQLFTKTTNYKFHIAFLILIHKWHNI